jgi:carbonic anhydrase
MNLSEIPADRFEETWDDMLYSAYRADWTYFGTVTAYTPGSSTVATTYYCYSNDFHSPAEHELDGDSFDLENQIWCSSSSTVETNYAAVFVTLYDSGDSNAFVNSIISGKMVPAQIVTATDFYSYVGSDNVPPCT